MLTRVHNVALVRRGFVVESNRFRISPRVHIFFVPHVCKTITSRIVSVEKAVATKQQQKKERKGKRLKSIKGSKRRKHTQQPTTSSHSSLDDR